MFPPTDSAKSAFDVFPTTDNVKDINPPRSLQEESENITSEISDTTSSEVDAESIVAEFYEKYKTMKAITELTFKYEEITEPEDLKDAYGIVLNERFKSIEDIRSFLITIHPQLTEQIIEDITKTVEAPGVYEPPMYVEQNGSLYMLKNPAYGRIYFSFWILDKVVIEAQDNKIINFTVPVYDNNPEYSREEQFTIINDGGNWVFKPKSE